MKKLGIILWNTLLKVQRFMMVVTGAATILLVFMPMVLRAVGIPFPAYEEFLLTVAFWMYMMGSSYGSYEKSQITADIFSQILKGKSKDIISIIISVCTFVLGIILTYWGYVLVQWALSTGAATSIYKIPIVLGQSSILVSLILTSIYNFVYMVEAILKVTHIRPIVMQEINEE